MEKNLDENVLSLVELYCHKGHIMDAMFGNNEQKKEQFLYNNGLRLYARDYEEAAEKYDNATTQEEMLKAKEKLNASAETIRKNVKDILLAKGIDLEAIYGKEPTKEEAKQMLFDQLEQLGLDKDTINSLGLQDVEQILYEGGKSFDFHVADNEQTRQAFDREEIEYEARDGRLHAKARLNATEGVAVNDTPENRRLLDENEIQYIDMAMGYNPKMREAKLFVPSTWMAVAKNEMRNQAYNSTLSVLNNQYSRNFLMTGSLVGISIAFALHPVFAVAAFVIMRKTGLMSKKNREVQPTLHEKKALQAGHTVYKENKKNGRIQGQYLFMHEGNLMRINAHDVRIPDYINGVHLTPVQKELFRKGEMIELKDKRGERFCARIDVGNPKLYREYYYEMKSDQHSKVVPDTQSADEDKLRYISKCGLRGIRNIYGNANINMYRDEFLQKYNLKDKFQEMVEDEAKYRNAPEGPEKEKYRGMAQKDSRELRDIAENELISLTQSNSRKI